MSTTSYPSHTPELASLLATMLATGAMLKRVARRDPLGALRSYEYKASTAAYRAYWRAVDADKATTRAASVPQA